MSKELEKFLEDKGIDCSDKTRPFSWEVMLIIWKEYANYVDIALENIKELNDQIDLYNDEVNQLRFKLHEKPEEMTVRQTIWLECYKEALQTHERVSPSKAANCALKHFDAKFPSIDPVNSISESATNYIPKFENFITGKGGVCGIVGCQNKAVYFDNDAPNPNFSYWCSDCWIAYKEQRGL